jgi:hypothetical protein
MGIDLRGHHQKPKNRGRGEDAFTLQVRRVAKERVREGCVIQLASGLRTPGEAGPNTIPFARPGERQTKYAPRGIKLWNPRQRTLSGLGSSALQALV